MRRRWASLCAQARLAVLANTALSVPPVKPLRRVWTVCRAHMSHRRASRRAQAPHAVLASLALSVSQAKSLPRAQHVPPVIGRLPLQVPPHARRVQLARTINCSGNLLLMPVWNALPACTQCTRVSRRV
jgi:hypothetical protein